MILASLRRPHVIAGLVCLTLVCSESRAAFLDGHTFFVRLNYRLSPTDPNTEMISDIYTVGPGVEIPSFGSPGNPQSFSVDISDRFITTTSLTDQPMNFQETLTFVFNPAGTEVFPFITSASNTSDTMWSGFTTFDVFGYESAVNVDLSTLSAFAPSKVVVRVIPEPASVMLGGVAVACLGVRRRRSRRLATSIVAWREVRRAQ
jgi:hypothetical protein